MKRPEKIVVKKDMLSLLSTVQEILRALYFYGVDYILAQSGKRERLLHKEQLVALLEQGREKATLEDTFVLELNEPISAKMQMEDIPPSVSLLLFVQTGTGAEGELSLSTFEEYRERKVRENMVIMPDWWSIPLPLAHIDDDRVFLNPRATETIPGGAVSMARQIERMRADRIVTIKEKKKERTFSLTPLAENTYFVEDISGDFEMAEDLVWWAAIGHAFVSRMQGNGLAVKRLSPFEEPPTDAAEVIPCHWENELVGRLAIHLPEEPAKDAAKPAETKKRAAAAKRDETPPPEPPKPAAPEPETAEKTEAPKKERKEKKKTEPNGRKKKTPPQAMPIQAEPLDAPEEPGAGTNLRKSAAKNAYGMRGLNPSVKSKKKTEEKTANDEPKGTREKE